MGVLDNISVENIPSGIPKMDEWKVTVYDMPGDDQNHTRIRNQIHQGIVYVVSRALTPGGTTRREKRIKRTEFIKKNWSLFQQLGKDLSWDNYSSTCQRIVELARLELTYSPKTGSQDIFRTIICLYKELL